MQYQAIRPTEYLQCRRCNKPMMGIVPPSSATFPPPRTVCECCGGKPTVRRKRPYTQK